MDLIVAVSENWGIGKDNGLLFSIPADMKFFRETTRDCVVIMGRKTLESFPGKKPLKNRVNIVLTENPEFEAEGVVVCHSVREAAECAENYDKKVFVIGGSAVYKEFLPLCDRAYVTKVHARAEADSFFPNLDEEETWHLEKKGEAMEDNGYCFEFTEYVNRKRSE